MSRVGKLPVAIPAGVTVAIEGATLKVAGPKGQLEQKLLPSVKVRVADDQLIVERQDDQKTSKAQHGLTRALANNMITGVSQGFSKKLEVNGIGYKVNLSGQTLKLALGFSHDIEYQIPTDVEVQVEQNTITIIGTDKQRVGQVAAEIRAFKKPEPYKGKGIKYEDEYIIRKSGKTAGSGD